MKIESKIFSIAMSIGKIQKTGKNDHFKSKYIELNGILDELNPLLEEKKLVMLMQPAAHRDGYIGIKLVFFDQESTAAAQNPLDNPRTWSDRLEYEPYYLPLAKTDPQGFGSAETYARRYLLMLVFNLQADDDDGNKGSNVPPKKAAPPAKPAPTPAPAAEPDPDLDKKFARVIEQITSQGLITFGDIESFLTAKGLLPKGENYMLTKQTSKAKIVAEPEKFENAITAHLSQ